MPDDLDDIEAYRRLAEAFDRDFERILGESNDVFAGALLHIQQARRTIDESQRHLTRSRTVTRTVGPAEKSSLAPKPVEQPTPKSLWEYLEESEDAADVVRPEVTKPEKPLPRRQSGLVAFSFGVFMALVAGGIGTLCR